MVVVYWLSVVRWCSCSLQQSSSVSVQEAANAQLISLSFIIHLFTLPGVGLQLTHFYLLWIFSSTFSAQKAFTSKSTPQAWRHKTDMFWYVDLFKYIFSSHLSGVYPQRSIFTFPVSSGPGCRVTEHGRFRGICKHKKYLSFWQIFAAEESFSFRHISWPHFIICRVSVQQPPPSQSVFLIKV